MNECSPVPLKRYHTSEFSPQITHDKLDQSHTYIEPVPTSNLNCSSSPENVNRCTRKRLTKQGNRGKEKYEENSPRRKRARTSNRETVIVNDDDSDEDESETESMDSFINDSEHDPASSSEEIPENIDTSSNDSGNEHVYMTLLQERDN